MRREVTSRLEEIAALCVKHRVKRLDLFGSAASGAFDPNRSDLDFAVEFEPLSPIEHADHFFGLKEDLEALFQRPVDLLELAPIRNPYLLKSIEQTRLRVYAA
jgi:uncharacterized protein